MKSVKILFAVLLLPGLLALGACSTNPATGEQSFTAFMSPEREMQIGREEHPKMLKAFGGIYDEGDIGAYISVIGGKLSQHSEMPGITWTFSVLNDPKVNAFAMPGGYVYITRGLLALASNEAEVAGVLAHEIGHVTARHSAQRYSTAVATSIGLQVLGAVGQAAGIGGVGDVAALGAQVALQSYSREQEMESDTLGVRYLVRAGYSPDAMTSFFTKLSAHQRIEGLMAGDENMAERSNIMATHPRTSERIENAIHLATANGSTQGRLDTKKYLKQVNGMLFGDEPAQGIIRGQAFIHPELGIRFEAPEGFRIINSPTQVVAKKDDDAAMVFDMAPVKDLQKAASLKDYVVNHWASGVRLSDVETINVNSMNAVTGAGSLSTRSGRRDVRVVAVDGGTNNVYRLLFLSDPSLTTRLNIPFRDATYSLRKLSQKEIAAVKPYRIRLYTVRPGDSAQSLAGKMAVSEFRNEWFEALNSIKPDDAIEPGSVVKIISE